MYPRTILHVNVTSFYVAVAQAVTPRLKSYPVAVATTGAARRVLLDISPVAHQAGLRRGMLLEQAHRKCHDLIVLDPTPDLYDRAFSVLLSEADQLSPQVEPAGPGHVFIDVSGTRRLMGEPLDNAVKLRARILSKYRLDPAVGIASNKLISKVATRLIKPYGLCHIVSGCEGELLLPLPIHILPGIDSKVISQLHQFNIYKIKDLITIKKNDLATVLGERAETILKVAHGIDTSPVRMRLQPAPTIRETRVLEGQTNIEEVIDKNMFTLVLSIAFQLRSLNMAAGSITLTLIYSDGLQSRGLTRLNVPLNGDLSLHEQCRRLYQKIATRRVRINTITLEATDISFPYGQLDLFENNEKEEVLMVALDKIRNGFGQRKIQFYGKELQNTSPKPIGTINARAA